MGPAILGCVSSFTEVCVMKCLNEKVIHHNASLLPANFKLLLSLIANMSNSYHSRLSLIDARIGLNADLLLVIGGAAAGLYSQMNGYRSQHASLKFPRLDSTEQKVTALRVGCCALRAACHLCMSRQLSALFSVCCFALISSRDLCCRSWRVVKTRPSWRNELEKCKN